MMSFNSKISSQIDEAIKIGKKLAELNLVEGTSGNISFRNNDIIVITKSGTNLAEHTHESFLRLRFGEKSELASRDLPIHEKIYKRTPYNAVVHCHGVYNVVLSFLLDKIDPMDLEGKIYLKEINVVEGEFGSPELVNKIVKEIAKKKVVVVRGHGIYSAAENLKKAFDLACYLEHSSKIIYLFLLLRR